MSNDTPRMAIRTRSEPLSTKYTVMFDRDIEESDAFHEEFYVMEQALETDKVDVCISSFGGSVATISKFQDVIKNSSAHFHGKLQGYGYSAGGALFLLCHTQEVSDLATFMAHSVQTGYSGGTQALSAHSKMHEKHNEMLCHMLYQDFLTEEEIVRVCDGAEIWMEAEEIRERLKKRDGIREERNKQEVLKEITQETYIQQCLEDIQEDCEYMGYDLQEVLKAFGKYIDVEKESSAIPSEEKLYHSFFYEGDYVKVYSNGAVSYNEEKYPNQFYKLVLEGVISMEHLKNIADIIGVPYAYNIGAETLAKKVDKMVEELVNELNQ